MRIYSIKLNINIKNSLYIFIEKHKSYLENYIQKEKKQPLSLMFASPPKTI